MSWTLDESDWKNIKLFKNLKGDIKMKLNKMTICSLLLAIGLLLHQISPPFFFGMRPDFLLIMMFICLLIDRDYKTALTVGLVSGLLTALTTSFPGGQVANIVDKLITANLVFFLIRLLEGIKEGVLSEKIKVLILSFIGTLVSGSVFLGTALILAGLPAPFKALVLTVVLPASLMNSITSLLIFGLVKKVMGILSIEA